ncbi:beta-phosphoglucomutase family hydrolase [Demequina sp. SYSU T00192]|uniref:Beta-phosphoglucomutase n=1 Tax=Demequina litoralis TaxID=3051660 RepID=A0ABT8G6F8_9MICO|nr:beta-phosphoglucomutase family hydrolase [Demequina sp. SYSU T00192]MDN4474725.1 beta-phosphoglucomutase family hydrolase [Demequina sp. SYSU T00192]
MTDLAAAPGRGPANQPRGVIFGLDGVLMRTDELHFQAWSVLADRLGVEFSRQDNERLQGMSRAESLDALLGLGATEVSRTEKEMLSEDMELIYRELLRGLSPAHVDPAVHDTLVRLREHGLRLAVGSAARNARVILERTGLRHRFDAISDGDNVAHGEPDPEVYLRAADFLALQPQACAVVVGTPQGVEAARRGGFVCIGIGAAATHPDATSTIAALPDVLAHFVG